MPGRIMSDSEIKHRKKIQGHVSQATGALGLAALGGTLAASRTGRKTLRKIPQLKAHINEPKPLHPDRDRMKGFTTPVLATSAGLGGLGAFNFASYTNAESRKRAQPVTKNHEPGIEMGYFGEEGHPVTLPAIEVPIEKAWSPTANNYDSEKSRGKRNQAYGGAALAGAGAAGAYGTMHGVQAGKNLKKVPIDVAPVSMGTVNDAGDKRMLPHMDKKKGNGHIFHEKGITLSRLKESHAAKHAGKSAAGLAVAGGALYGAKKIKDKHNSGWQPYSKRDAVSAFGIDHSH